MHDSMLYKINETPVTDENSVISNSEVDLSSDIGDF
jgi:hypothetical protein